MRIDRVVESSIGAGIIGAAFVAWKLLGNYRRTGEALNNFRDEYNANFSAYFPDIYERVTGGTFFDYLRNKYR